MEKLRPKIPVPEVFAYSDQSQELGGRYLLMEGICGLKAEAEYFIFGIPDRHWNHVLEQFGEVMAEGMAIWWKDFQIDGKVFKSDSEFWIDPAVQNVRIALHEMGKHRQNFDEQQYSTFLKQNQPNFQLLFVELLYLCSELLRRPRRPSSAHEMFPSNLPPLSMENIVFDFEYHVKGMIGFSRSESVSSWDYFQYPLGLEESFDDPSMTRTAAWMKESFIESWKRRLDRLDIRWDGMEEREPWCHKDKVKILREFRISNARSSILLEKLVSELYHFDGSVTLDLLYCAHIYTTCSVLSQRTTAWDPNNVDLHVEVFTRMISTNVTGLHDLAGAGQGLKKGMFDSRILQLPTFAQTVP
jgi:hypothetical protein